MLKYKKNNGFGMTGDIVHMRTGSQLIQTLSNSLYTNVYYVFDELISNAYDADATRVGIKIEDDKITIKDNGEGMDRQGIENFFDLGYSPKLNTRVTRRKRVTIGKFGIGKLTTANICDKCIIETVKNGNKITAELDFKHILKHRYLHEAEIELNEKATGEPNGTTITLCDLKNMVTTTILKRRIMRSMPLNPDFGVSINDVELNPEDIVSGMKFPIKFTGKLVGNVTGELTLSNEGLKEYAGVYVRVNRRIVNADNPDWLSSVMITKFSSPMSFISRIYCIVDADKLDECILANRNEFKKDHPTFVEFREFMIDELRKINNKSIDEHNEANLDYERNIAKDVIEKQINKMIQSIDPPDDWMIQYSKRKDAEEIKGIIRKIKRKQSDATEESKESDLSSKNGEQKPNRGEFSFNERIIKIGRKRFKFKITTTMGKHDKECVFDTGEGVIYINANHPQYLASRAEDSLYCHFRKSIAFELACTMAKNTYTELIDKYQGMMRTDVEVIEGTED